MPSDSEVSDLGSSTTSSVSLNFRQSRSWPQSSRNSEYSADRERSAHLIKLRPSASWPNQKDSGYDPSWINLDLLRGWLSTCDSKHGEKCSHTPSPTTAPLWLVDVSPDRLCLVRGDSCNKYAALSYVWGQVRSFLTLEKNLEKLQVPGAFSEENAPSIPRTIRDAMKLAAQLGIRLLWVDSLCIVQDDKDIKHAQLQDMASIYRNAYVTLAATTGTNASAGIQGLRGVSERRDYLGRGRESHFLQNPLDLTYNSIHTRWYQRGWTFQELLFSRRTIFLHPDSCVFECASTVWSDLWEDVYHDTTFPPTLAHYKHWEESTWPDYKQYLRLVCDYNGRDLTYPSDVFDAFAGVTTTLGPTFGNFIHGLPETIFDVALLWQPAADATLTRRVTTAPLPSWSWVGWQGRLDPESWNTGCFYLYHFYNSTTRPSELEDLEDISFKTRTISLCRWRITTHDDNKTPINPTFEAYRSKFRSPDFFIPDGWRKVVDKSGVASYIQPTRYGRKQFTMPFPAILPNQYTHPSSYTSYLHTKAAKTTLRTRPYNPDIKTRKDKDSFIMNEAGEKIGWLTLHTAGAENPFQEFIALSKGVGKPNSVYSIPAGSYSHGARDLLRNLAGYATSRTKIGHEFDSFRFVNVMCVAWEDGIAFRKGVGWVSANAWEKCSKETIELTLG